VTRRAEDRPGRRGVGNPTDQRRAAQRGNRLGRDEPTRHAAGRCAPAPAALSLRRLLGERGARHRKSGQLFGLARGTGRREDA
jgi:hypothetical protein